MLSCQGTLGLPASGLGSGLRVSNEVTMFEGRGPSWSSLQNDLCLTGNKAYFLYLNSFPVGEISQLLASGDHCAEHVHPSLAKADTTCSMEGLGMWWPSQQPPVSSLVRGFPEKFPLQGKMGFTAVLHVLQSYNYSNAFEKSPRTG